MHANRTQEWTSHETGIPTSTYQDIERGLSDPRISDLLLIAHSLAVPLTDLVEAPRPPQ